MKKLVNAAFIYMLAGVASGLFYREFTKANDFTDATFTQLAVVHTHLLILGFLVLLVVLVIEKVFAISRSPRLYAWFLWLYNLGVILTAGMMIWHGTLTVLGEESNGMIAGIAGLGHILITAGLIVFFVALRRAVSRDSAGSAQAEHAVSAGE